MQQKHDIAEVSFIRPLLIIFLVLYHAFAPFTGTWREFDGFVPNEAYRFIANISYSSMLETFVFISGYIFCFQTLYLKKNYGFVQLALKKGKRLLLPYLIFGVLYILIFGTWSGNPVTYFIRELSGGVAHLWFLLMLFWCFLALWLLLRLRLNDTTLLVLLLALALCSPIGKIFQIGSAMYYLLFFYLGWLMFKHQETIRKRIGYKDILIFLVVYLLAFLFLSKDVGILRSYFLSHKGLPFFTNACIMGGMRMLRLSYSTLGVLLYFLIAIKFTSSHTLHGQYIKFGSLCLGIYIFQQFILQFLYYKTSLPLVVGSNSLPWIGFAIALILSTILTYLFRLLPFGKKCL